MMFDQAWTCAEFLTKIAAVQRSQACKSGRKSYWLRIMAIAMGMGGVGVIMSLVAACCGVCLLSDGDIVANCGPLRKLADIHE